MNAMAAASLNQLSHRQAGDRDVTEEKKLKLLKGELRQLPDQVLRESMQRMQRYGFPDRGEKYRLWLRAARAELARRHGAAGCSAPPRPHGRQGEPVSQDDGTYEMIVRLMCAEPSAEPLIANVQLPDDLQVPSSLPDQVETHARPSKQQQHHQQKRDVQIIKPKLEPLDRREGSPVPAPDATEDCETTPLSGDNPFFSVVMARTHVEMPFQITIPLRFQRHLPKACTAVVLLCRGKSWEMSYRGDLTAKKLDSAWMDFAIDNRLKVNDACVFELVNAAAGSEEEDGVVFRVQILRGGLPEGLVSKGRIADEPILIDD